MCLPWTRSDTGSATRAICSPVWSGVGTQSWPYCKRSSPRSRVPCAQCSPRSAPARTRRVTCCSWSLGSDESQPDPTGVRVGARRESDEVGTNGPPGGLDPILDLKLHQDARDVILDCVLAQEQCPSDARV